MYCILLLLLLLSVFNRSSFLEMLHVEEGRLREDRHKVIIGGFHRTAVLPVGQRTNSDKAHNGTLSNDVNQINHQLSIVHRGGAYGKLISLSGA